MCMFINELNAGWQQVRTKICFLVHCLYIQYIYKLAKGLIDISGFDFDIIAGNGLVSVKNFVVAGKFAKLDPCRTLSSVFKLSYTKHISTPALYLKLFCYYSTMFYSEISHPLQQTSALERHVSWTWWTQRRGENKSEAASGREHTHKHNYCIHKHTPYAACNGKQQVSLQFIHFC